MSKNPMIRLGCSGAFVEQWQRFIGEPVTGKFDATTEAATRAFQRTHALVDSGVVGPFSWTVAEAMANAPTQPRLAVPDSDPPPTAA